MKPRNCIVLTLILIVAEIGLFTSTIWAQTPTAPLPVAPLPAAPLPAAPKPGEHEIQSLRLAIEDLIATFGSAYPNGQQYLSRLHAVESAPEASTTAGNDFRLLKQEALLANPLLGKFEKILAVRRSARNLGMPANWESNSSLAKTGYANDLISIPVQPLPTVTSVFKPEHDQYIGELDLNYDGRRLMFSMPAIGQPDSNGRWQLYELDLLAGELKMIPTVPDSDVDNYDGCWLPDGGICFTSTAPMVGVPCVRGNSHVTNLYVKKPDGTIRQLTVDQEHNWNPTVMANGRIMYLRWEYTDIPHAFYRLLFTVNPDGTNQVEYYGSNSYWPNSMFNAKPCPGAPNRFFAVVVGHHDTARAGELILFDASISNFEADGAVQRITQRGKKIEPILLDGLTQNSWPKFLHPYPLSDKYVLTACKPTKESNWGLYLVDVFDNMLLIYEEPGFAILEPTPVMETSVPPAIADRTDPDAKDATVFLADIYTGPGLKGIQRGQVKNLRLFTYNFSYQGMGGQVDRVGLDGPWDVRMVLGTVPVEPDGSAHFTVPAYIPIAVQPLDENGCALQMMRSWFTAMPGEVVSCIGCHQRTNLAPITVRTQAGNRQASAIKPYSWSSPESNQISGFSFRRHVQPVLDRLCIGCHAQNRAESLPAEMEQTFSLEDTDNEPAVSGASYYFNSALFSRSYMNLRRFVRGQTIESGVHMLTPCEFHANTTRLIQLLRDDPNGHYGVAKLLTNDDWTRINAWIDMNTPFHGTWREISGTERTDNQARRREQLRQMYADVNMDQEATDDNAYVRNAIQPVLPDRAAIEAGITARRNSVTTKPAAVSSTVAADSPEIITVLEIPLSDTVKIRCKRVPSGTLNGQPVEGFYVSECEITNAQYRAFDAHHDSRYEPADFLLFSIEDQGFPCNGHTQPVVRVSSNEAEAFCQWLSSKIKRPVSLPTGLQWEYAARAGSTSGEMYFSPAESSTSELDFSLFANLSDKTNYDIPTYRPWGLPSGAIPPWRPADTRFNDHFRATAPVGSFKPNAWGLYDVHGNVWEWTADRDENQAFVRGGSWNSRPAEARFQKSLRYPVNQKVFDVGFRIIVE